MRKSIAGRRSQFEQLRPRPGQFVFLGDSNIEQGAWNEWFPTLPCINRGIGGDTVNGARLRLDSAINQPLGVALVIGSNDVADFRGSQKVPEVADELHRLITDIKSLAPGAALFLNSVLPRSREMSDAIRSLNERYRERRDQDGNDLHRCVERSGCDRRVRAPRVHLRRPPPQRPGIPHVGQHPAAAHRVPRFARWGSLTKRDRQAHLALERGAMLPEAEPIVGRHCDRPRPPERSTT